MAEENSAAEKSEQPTDKRRTDAREKGEVPRSRELNTVISLLFAACGMAALAEQLGSGLLSQLTRGLTVRDKELSGSAQILEVASAALTDTMLFLSPFLAVMMLSVFVGPMLMGGFVFNIASAAPKLEKLDPLKGLGRIFSMNGLMELTKALGKFLLVGSIAWLFINAMLIDVVGLGYEPVNQAITHAVQLIVLCLLATSAILILVASIDVPFQQFQYTKKLKMTKQEVKDELKETEGRPEVKSKIRALQQEIAQRRMMEDVKQADVVIRNPTHFAVALKYDEAMGAPTLVASGKDLIALEIIRVAQENDVFVFSAPPLARAIYANTEIGFEIPAGLYVAVAQVLAYVFQLKESVDTDLHPPADFDIPAELIENNDE